MQKRIIDLRDPLPKLPEVQPHGLQDTVSREISARMGHADERKATSGAGRPLIEWTALEYPAVERGPYWWMPPSAIALLCVLFGILVKSYLFAGFAVLALFVVLLYSRRPPREYRFAISREGVYIGERCHRWSELESFWIFEHADHQELSLETKTGRIFPYLYLPLGDTHSNRIRRVASDFLPEKEHTEMFTDQIARSIGF
ncbi:MAG: hypothetical protein A3C92_02900 [Candidatus Sungbacteria bacterium RIFCSPHIGHO2_02_FULL_53_17]|uniref:DUF5673 domain-containing protein n=1 Tax=Candidatus Sungbacteria bacterium RIFCSPHIGHO2_02_FULL_53_17 TaxID=1802275 RepID=A0A1G2KWQ9_9BACT|nr:MAG: hypothetical protein A3C92_02900 [Candidatus Sungbacteria bacterium RIFCSPHIGHO2_02_FULL_53_17]